jgi:hypothetical protein
MCEFTEVENIEVVNVFKRNVEFHKILGFKAMIDNFDLLLFE